MTNGCPPDEEGRCSPEGYLCRGSGSGGGGGGSGGSGGGGGGGGECVHRSRLCAATGKCGHEAYEPCLGEPGKCASNGTNGEEGHIFECQSQTAWGFVDEMAFCPSTYLSREYCESRVLEPSDVQVVDFLG